MLSGFEAIPALRGVLGINWSSVSPCKFRRQRTRMPNKAASTLGSHTQQGLGKNGEEYYRCANVKLRSQLFGFI